MVDKKENCTYNICTDSGSFAWNILKNETKCIRGLDDTIRIISARKADRVEREIYEKYANNKS